MLIGPLYTITLACTFCCSCAMLYSREKPSLVLYIIQIINIVGHRCLWLSRTTSRHISRYFERVPLLTRFRANA